jgi:hypothetical protein
MEMREQSSLADDITGLMAAAAVRASMDIVAHKPLQTARERNQVRILGALAGQLGIIHISLQCPQAGKQEIISTRLRNALRQLEAVCMASLQALLSGIVDGLTLSFLQWPSKLSSKRPRSRPSALPPQPFVSHAGRLQPGGY